MHRRRHGHRDHHRAGVSAMSYSEFQSRNRRRRHRTRHLGHARTLDERHQPDGDRGIGGDRREGRGRRRDQGRGDHLRQRHLLRRRGSDLAGKSHARIRRDGEEPGRGAGRRRCCSRKAASCRSFIGGSRPAASRSSPRSTAPRSAAGSSFASPAISASPPTIRRRGVGLPEIKIGLFPGAGGTQRVARMIMPADALQLLLKGDQLRLNRAKAMKLVDNVVPRRRSREDREGVDQGRRQSRQAVGRAGLQIPGRARLLQGRA